MMRICAIIPMILISNIIVCIQNAIFVLSKSNARMTAGHPRIMFMEYYASVCNVFRESPVIWKAERRFSIVK